jgi:glycerol-3-phosphate cytidylyltransferase-like family protein
VRESENNDVQVKLFRPGETVKPFLGMDESGHDRAAKREKAQAKMGNNNEVERVSGLEAVSRISSMYQ